MNTDVNLNGQSLRPKDLSIAVATPSLRETFSGYYVKCTREFHELCFKNDIHVEFLLEGRISIVSHARNRLVQRFLLETNCSHLLFIDDDIGFNADHLMQMLNFSNLPVVGALYPQRSIDWEKVKEIVLSIGHIPSEDIATCAASYRNNVGWLGAAPDIKTISSPAPFRVSFVATGLMLISRSCLETIIKNQTIFTYDFEVQNNSEIRTHKFWEFFRSHVDSNGVFLGEDAYFCRLIQDSGFPIHAYGAIHVVHSGITDYFGYPEVKFRHDVSI